MAFDGSSDITLKASHVGAFALGKTGSTVANDKAVGWNWSSGAYNATISGASTLIIHFYMGEGSCPAAQFRINYKNGGIFIVQPVMVMVLKPTGPNFTPPENLQQEMLVHCRYLVVN